MKQINAVTRGLRTEVSGPIVASFLALALLANAATAGAQVTVAVGNGSGPPGGTASVTMSLTGGGGKVATVGFDVTFDVNVLAIQTSNCTIAPRLAPTHTLAPFLPSPGTLRLGIFDLSPPLNAFDDGDLATCIFDINSSAVLGTTSQLTMVLGADAVSDDSVPPVVLASTGSNGGVAVSLVTPTPTLTSGQGPTSTPTNTPANTPTKTVQLPTNTPTATPPNTVPPSSPTPTATRTNPAGSPTPTKTVQSTGGGGGGGCAIATPNSADVSPLTWLIVPAAALLWRRRARL